MRTPFVSAIFFFFLVFQIAHSQDTRTQNTPKDAVQRKDVFPGCRETSI